MICAMCLMASMLHINSFAAEYRAAAQDMKQVRTVFRFYEVLSSTRLATVEDYFDLFGKENEAELELILRNKFPTLDINGRWFDVKEAKQYVDEVYQNPGRHQSHFLRCLRSMEQRLFGTRISRTFEFPLQDKGGFRTVVVTDRGKKVQFRFSQDELLPDDVLLPNGRSIYGLIPICAKRTSVIDKSSDGED